MKKYLPFFRMRFISGLQYRAAAAAGVATQFAWGGIFILMFSAFYRSDPAAFPMTFPQLSSYLWLQQAFLSLFMVWILDNDIFSSVTSGGVAYELCRPIGLYGIWFAKSIAGRVGRAVLRCLPILVFAAFLPPPYSIGLPPDAASALMFLLSAALGCLVVTAFCMLIYISVFFTLSPYGVRAAVVPLVDIFSGAVVPLPFLPDGVRRAFELLPFASMQNTPFLIYSGYMTGTDAARAMLLQVFWLAVFFLTGRLLMKTALKRVTVQGG